MSLTEVGRSAHWPGFPDDLGEWSPLPALTAHLPLEQDVRSENSSILFKPLYSGLFLKAA